MQAESDPQLNEATDEAEPLLADNPRHDLAPPGATSQVFEQFEERARTHAPPNDIDILILDIPVQLTVELGRTKIPIKNILQLAQGSVVELDALAGEPMDVFVNGCLIAHGEVVVVNDPFRDSPHRHRHALRAVAPLEQVSMSWRSDAGRVLTGLLAASSPCIAHAQSPSATGAALQALAGLAIVVLIIIGAAHMLRRLAPRRFNKTQLLRSVSTLSLGTRERVVVVEMNDTWLVLGVTASSITMLHSAPKGDLPAAPSFSSAHNPPFIAWLARARQPYADK